MMEANIVGPVSLLSNALQQNVDEDLVHVAEHQGIQSRNSTFKDDHDVHAKLFCPEGGHIICQIQRATMCCNSSTSRRLRT